MIFPSAVQRRRGGSLTFSRSGGQAFPSALGHRASFQSDYTLILQAKKRRPQLTSRRLQEHFFHPTAPPPNTPAAFNPLPRSSPSSPTHTKPRLDVLLRVTFTPDVLLALPHAIQPPQQTPPAPQPTLPLTQPSSRSPSRVVLISSCSFVMCKLAPSALPLPVRLHRRTQEPFASVLQRSCIALGHNDREPQ